jgi:hypothetical protein
LCFVTYSGWEHEEKIKSLYELRRENYQEWDDNWYQFFDTKNIADAIKVKEKYNELLEFFKEEMEN